MLIITHIHFEVAIGPINQRGLQRPMYRSLAVLDMLAQSGKITNLEQPKDPEHGPDWARYIRTFDVPSNHLRQVERLLQHNKIGYRKALQ